MRTCSVSSPTQRDVLKEGMIAGFSFVPFGPMIGSRLQKMSGVLRISFFSIPVDMSSLSTITPGKQIRQSEKNRRKSAKFSSCAAWACARQLFEQRRRRREQLWYRCLRAGVRRKKAHLTAAAAPPWRQSSARWSASRLAAWRRLEAGKVGSEALCVSEPLSLW